METEENKIFRKSFSNGMGFGLVLLLIGLVFLGLNFGLIPHSFKRIIISWQMLLIFLGVINLFKFKFVPGAILIFIGGFFMIPKIVPGIDGNFIHVYWPLLLIGAGILILTKRLIYPNSGFEAWGEKWQQHGNRMHQKFQHNRGQNWERNPDGFSKNSVFGSGEHIVLDKEFKGGELNAVFGGLTIDLRRTNLPEGETVLDVNAVFGGITIIVPYEWLVETHIDAVFGGFQDNRMPKEPLDTTRKLIITGACVFGGGELRN